MSNSESVTPAELNFYVSEVKRLRGELEKLLVYEGNEDEWICKGCSAAPKESPGEVAHQKVCPLYPRVYISPFATRNWI
jgi:hypothetical protein